MVLSVSRCHQYIPQALEAHQTSVMVLQQQRSAVGYQVKIRIKMAVGLKRSHLLNPKIRCAVRRRLGPSCEVSFQYTSADIGKRIIDCAGIDTNRCGKTD